jgi:hypothetical protein
MGRFGMIRAAPVTVWPPVTEAMYLLGDLPKAQEALWEMLARGVLQFLPLDLTDVPRMRELMTAILGGTLTGFLYGQGLLEIFVKSPSRVASVCHSASVNKMTFERAVASTPKTSPLPSPEAT